MRIISGLYRGRRINPPSNLPVRPTTDMAKESLFNILRNMVDFEESKVLDLFSGTGSIAYEFASRGSKDVTCVEINQKCVNFISQTSEKINIPGFRVVRANVFQFLKMNRAKYDIIFADPPFDLEGIESLPDLILKTDILKPDGILIIEHSKNIIFASHPSLKEHRNYGKVNFSFFIPK